MTTTETTPDKPIDARVLLKDLQTRFDVFRNFSPLAIGIDKQVFAQLPEVSKKALRLAMRSHTISTRYLKEMEKGTVRLNLDGTPAGETHIIGLAVTIPTQRCVWQVRRRRSTGGGWVGERGQASERRGGEANYKCAA